MCGQIFRCIEQPQKSLAAHARGRFTSPISRGDPLIPAPLVVGPTVSSIAGSFDDRNRQRCIFPPLGAQTPASRILRINSFGTRSRFSRRIDLGVPRCTQLLSFRKHAAGKRGNAIKPH